MSRRAALILSLESRARGLAVGLALAGGFLLLAIVVLNTVSIGLRALLPLGIGSGPIAGIYDITEMGVAVAVFAFLPYCQFTDGHASVDLLRGRFGKLFDAVSALMFHLLMLTVASVGTWRLYLGMVDKRSFGETTFIAQIPLWYGYAACLAGATGFVLVAAFCVLRAALMPYHARPGQQRHD